MWWGSVKYLFTGSLCCEGCFLVSRNLICVNHWTDFGDVRPLCNSYGFDFLTFWFMAIHGMASLCCFLIFFASFCPLFFSSFLIWSGRCEDSILLFSTRRVPLGAGRCYLVLCCMTSRTCHNVENYEMFRGRLDVFSELVPSFAADQLVIGIRSFWWQ